MLPWEAGRCVSGDSRGRVKVVFPHAASLFYEPPLCSYQQFSLPFPSFVCAWGPLLFAHLSKTLTLPYRHVSWQFTHISTFSAGLVSSNRECNFLQTLLAYFFFVRYYDSPTSISTLAYTRAQTEQCYSFPSYRNNAVAGIMKGEFSSKKKANQRFMGTGVQ